VAGVGHAAFIFPGQGSQRPGMGAELRAERPERFEHYFGLAEEASGLPVGKLALEGPEDELTRTDVAQPALFALSLALAEAADELGLRADFVGGHSLGEYTAAVASGALGVEDGMRLVAQRGRLMANAQNERPGAMAAIIGLDPQRVAELCGEAAALGTVAPANFNTPTQTIASGEQAAVGRLLELAERAGAERAVRLQVGAAFHSVLMQGVQAEMAEAMARVSWRDPHTPLMSNAFAELQLTGEDVRRALVAQIASPVRWVECVEGLVARGVRVALELGSGRVLSGLVRQIDRDVETHAADSAKKLARFARAPASPQRPQGDGEGA
jgi:[acyl-carrier-protein] S-malonyltransferase